MLRVQLSTTAAPRSELQLAVILVTFWLSKRGYHTQLE